MDAAQHRPKALIDLWDVTDLDQAFGPRITWPDRLDPEVRAVPRQYTDAVSTLFFRGGRLADVGFALRPDVDAKRFYGCLRAILGSFDPPHEVKEAVAGSLVARYCDPLPTAASSNEGADPCP